MYWWEKERVSRYLRVEAEVELREERFHLIKKVHGNPKEEKCEESNQECVLQVNEISYIFCKKCNGNNHEESYKSSPIKHPLHPDHTLMYVSCADVGERKCYCCEDPLQKLFYCCPNCDLGINLACVDDKPLISIDHAKRHEHTLTLSPRQVTKHCNVCASDDSRSPKYTCLPCDFIVHKRCINLPSSIQISRHPQHRLSFTSSFVVGEKFCNICRTRMNNDYGGYICNKEGCSYFAHSRCATRENVWDGKELKGKPEEVEEEDKPFERLGDGSIRHFSHKHHPLKLNDGDTTRDYDEYRSCQACLRPIYEGNFYSCLDSACSFILHEACANIPLTIYHAIHPHQLVLRERSLDLPHCSACYQVCSTLFFECSRDETEKCRFKLHVHCANVHEPLVHKSHDHPLFLTSTPQEWRSCSICKGSRRRYTNETFNCIECDDFSLCYECASLPQKVRYKHDEHFLTLFYSEKETSETQHWCEICEMKIEQGEMFYKCEEDCFVTLHIDCLLGGERIFKLGTHNFLGVFDVLPNNSITRPVCSSCNKRCSEKIVFERGGLKYCCFYCSTLVLARRIGRSRVIEF